MIADPSAPPTAAEAAALDAVDRDGLVRTLADLVALPSVGGSAAESEAQHWYAGRLAELGLDVDTWRIGLDEVTAADGFPGVEVERTEAWGVVGQWPGSADAGTFVLQGHIDVVPPGKRANWSSDPFTPVLRGESLYGRGACDMKAGLACNLHAVAAMRRAGVRPRATVAVHSVVGEEDGGLGAFATLRRGHRGDAAVITEPTGGAVMPANAGALTFRLRVPGRSTHASMRLDGVSAVEKFRPVWDALVALEERRNRDPDPLMAHLRLPYPLSIGTVRAGDWPSSVPDSLVAQGRLGVRLGEDPAAARHALEQAVAQACQADPWLAEHPATVEWYGGQYASGRLPDGHPLLAHVSGAHAVLAGQPPAVHGAPYGSDLRLLEAAGVPAVQYGPGEVRHAHAADERVRVADLVRVTEVLILSAMRWVSPLG